MHLFSKIAEGVLCPFIQVINEDTKLFFLQKRACGKMQLWKYMPLFKLRPDFYDLLMSSQQVHRFQNNS